MVFYISRSNIFVERNRPVIRNIFVTVFFVNGTKLVFFLSPGKIHSLRQKLNMIFNGLQTKLK